MRYADLVAASQHELYDVLTTIWEHREAVRWRDERYYFVVIDPPLARRIREALGEDREEEKHADDAQPIRPDITQ